MKTKRHRGGSVVGTPSRPGRYGRAYEYTFPDRLIENNFVTISVPLNSTIVNNVFLWKDQVDEDIELYIKIPDGFRTSDFELFVGSGSLYRNDPTSGTSLGNPLE
ncbi:MAG: hypothetical protein CME61_09835 [Halobacteriovoraceae bacterium]|nr:hypothetical protein [Halobacteriovoraceae bacterium]